MVEDSDVAYVVEKLSEFVEPNKIMLVGARCRDIHQRKYRFSPAARTTDDIDFALAIESWDAFLAVKEAFPSPGKMWQRIDINGIPIDLVPFGEVENPPGEVSGDDNHVLNVAGFHEVFVAAEDLPLTGKISVKLPSVPGFAGLKLHAWLDRWPMGKYKDASDLALILSWYEEDDDTLWDRYLLLIDDKEEYLDDKEKYLGDTDAMAVELLGFDVGGVLGVCGTVTLLKRFEKESADDLDHFAERLIAPSEHEHPLGRRSLQVEALLHGLKLSTH